MHRRRPPHAKRHPVHVTLRARRNLPSFRHQAVLAMFLRLLAQRPRADFQIVQFSVQSDHLHLLVEVDDKDILARAMNSVAARFAKRLNRLLGRRRGKVWDHRYHRRDLASPTEVRSALRYVLHNWKKHGHASADTPVLDPFSSASASASASASSPPPAARGDPEPWRPPRARTWLLRHGSQQPAPPAPRLHGRSVGSATLSRGHLLRA